jgi:hypothetical protein
MDYLPTALDQIAALAVKVSEFERRQLAAVRKELDQNTRPWPASMQSPQRMETSPENPATLGLDPPDFFTGSQIIIASNPTAAIPTIKKASAAASYSSQYLCTRMKSILHRGMGEHQLSMDN